MKYKRKLKNRNPVPKPMFYPDKASMRGGLVDTKDGLAIFIAFVSMLIFLFFGFFSVIFDSSKAEENEENQDKLERMEEYML